MSTTITTRQTAGTGATVKGSPLTNTEVDNNFLNLNVAVLPTGGTAGQVLSKIDGTNFNAQWIDNFSTALKIAVKNSTGTTITKGSAVYVSGATGSNVLVALAQANAESTSSQTLGLVEADIANGATGNVIYTGTIVGVNTLAYTEGDPVFLSGTTAGGIVVGLANKPAAPTHLVYLGVVTRSHATVGEIQIRVSNGWELSEIHDVQIVSKANNDIIQYDSASGLWKNVTAANARTNLGLAIGTNVQAWDADLDAIGALAGTSGFLKKTAANTWSLDTNTYLTTAVTSVGGTGTVSGLTLTGTVTTTGSLTLGGTLSVTASNFASQTANTFLAAPNGAAGVPTFRALVAADIPSLSSTYLPLSGGTLTGALNGTTASFNGGGSLPLTLTTSSAGPWSISLVRSDLGLSSNVYNGTGNQWYFQHRPSFVGNTPLDSGNYTSYAPSLTGSGASGTWGISISGNSATATTATSLSGGTINGLTLNQYNVANARLYSVTPGAMGLLGVDSNGAYRWQVYGDGTAYGFLDSAWGNWDVQKTINGNMTLRVSTVSQTVLHSGNFSSYSPSLTGSGASGTWSINVTGSAGSATSATNATNVSGGSVQGSYIGVQNTSGSTGYGISLYNGATAGQPQYGLFFGQTASWGTHGSVTADWATYFTMDSTANRGWVFRNTVSGNVASINNSGTAVFNGNVTAYSDETLKRDWAPLAEDFVARLAKVKHGTYTRIDSGERHAGASAQSMKALLAEVVQSDADGKLSLAYGNAALVSAIQIAKRLVTLEATVAKLVD